MELEKNDHIFQHQANTKTSKTHQLNSTHPEIMHILLKVHFPDKVSQ